MEIKERIAAFTSFATAKAIVCKQGAVAVTQGELMRVSLSGRKNLENVEARHCADNCFDGTCKLVELKRILNPIVKHNTR